MGLEVVRILEASQQSLQAQEAPVSPQESEISHFPATPISLLRTG